MRYVESSVLSALALRKMAFIAGPRQVGKTTLARSLLAQPEAAYFNWDVDAHRRALLKAPTDFWPADRVDRIVLDEIHKYPRWKRLLKGLYDTRGRDVEILVTGSGRLDVYQRGGDSLLGRYFLNRLHPFTVGELLAAGRQNVLPPSEFIRELLAGGAVAEAKAEDALARIERFTGFPEPLFSGRMDVLRRWRRARRELVLREDLRDLTRIRDLGLIDQMVELLPERVGSPLSVNALREDIGVAFDTVKSWIETLQRLYYLFEIRPFAGKLARTLRREAKVYLYDYSVVEDAGARFENIVALHLRKLVDAWNDQGEGDFALCYVRDKERREVDFLVTERRRPWLLIETQLSGRDVSPSLRYYRNQFRVPHTVQLVRSGSRFSSDGVVVVPAAAALALI
jgi:uncharacterized protein